MVLIILALLFQVDDPIVQLLNNEEQSDTSDEQDAEPTAALVSETVLNFGSDRSNHFSSTKSCHFL